MRRILKTFVVPAGTPAGSPPEPGPDVEFEALAKRGQRARAVSFTPTGLVAYARPSEASEEALQSIADRSRARPAIDTTALDAPPFG